MKYCNLHIFVILIAFSKNEVTKICNEPGINYCMLSLTNDCVPKNVLQEGLCFDFFNSSNVMCAQCKICHSLLDC